MRNKKSFIATTISATIVLALATTIKTIQPIEITNVRTDNELTVGVLSDVHAAKWFKFKNLAKEWRAQRGTRSSVTEMSTVPAYQAVIGMGEDAVPLIISQLRIEGDDPDQWFWALKSITQVDPVKPEDRGDFMKMAEAWIDWAKDEGYVG